MSKNLLFLGRWTLPVCLLFLMPAIAQADEVVVADAGGNELRYTYEGAYGAATLASVVSLVTTDVVVANSVTDTDGNNHVVKSVASGVFYNKNTITSLTFGEALETIYNDYTVFYNLAALKRMVLPGVNFPFQRNPELPSTAILVVHPDLVETYQTSDYTKKYRIMAYGAVTEVTVTTTSGSQLQAKVEATGAQPAYLERLTVTGPLNGTDIDFLHSAMPCLQELDLSQASIVEGGDKYHRWSVNNNGTATINGSSTWATQNNTIGERMFYNMPMLRRLVLPQGTKAINNLAVSECKILEECVLPEGLLSIGDEAFRYDYKLSQAPLPSTLTAIGEYAFHDTALREVTIPTGVTILERDVFWSCDSLRRVIMHDGIKEIRRAVFSECSNLEDIGGIPANIEIIGINAFEYDRKLITPIVIPASCKTIDWEAFQDCEKIPSVTFNEGLESINHGAFYGCRTATFNAVPSTVTKIDYDAFRNCDGLTEFTFPAGVTQVAHDIMRDCDNLERVTLAEGTTKIGSSAFYNCPKLATINLNQPTLTSIDGDAFQYTALVDVVLPNSITSMGSSIFANCSQLQSINVPTGMTTVPSYFCYKCTQLTSAVLHSGLTSISSNAFRECKQLTTLTVDGTATTVLPDGITLIESSAFEKCENLVITQLPAQLQRISEYAFYQMKALRELDIPATVTRIDYQAFYGSGLTAVTLHEGITNWGSDIFAYCDQLASVTLPSDMTIIPSSMFYGTTALANIDLPDGLQIIRNSAFCRGGLAAIDLPESLQTIEYYAFYATQLEELIIPDSVKTVGSQVAAYSKKLRKAFLGHNQAYDNGSFDYFYGCDSLEWLRIYAGTPPAISEYNSRSYRKNCVLEVPEGQDVLYAETDVWKEFKEIRTFFTGDVLNALDFAVMQQMYRDLDGANWKNPWDLTNDHRSIGKWHGVTTEGDFITAIDLTEQGLVGELPDSVFVLPQLKKLTLNRNRISGDLGTVLAGFADEELSPLTELYLQGNQFRGDLYPFASRLPLLTNLNVSYNYITEVSQPFSNAVLSNNNFYRGYQFIDWETNEVVVPEWAEGLVTDITVGVPADIPNNTCQMYRHEAGDYDLQFSSLYRVYKNRWGDLSTSNTELVKNSDGLWTLFSGRGNYILQAPKGQVVAYTHGMPWYSILTYLLRFDWQDGDVNADQTVDVSDLQSVIYYTLYDQKADGQMFNYTCADVNVDNAINVLDVIGTVDEIFAYEEPAGARAAVSNADATGVIDTRNQLTVDGSAVILANTEEVAALQLFISGATTGQLHIADDIKARFAVAMRNVNGGVRLVVYSAAGRTLAPGQHTLLRDLPAGATVTDVRLTDPQASRLGVVITGEPTAIPSIATQSQPTEQIFDLSGRRLTTEWEQLPAGIYVIEVNGKQYKVKK